MANFDDADLVIAPLTKASLNGNAYVAATSVQALTLLLTHLRVIISNPSIASGSNPLGKTLYLSKATGWNNQGAGRARVFYNPTTTVTANNLSINNLNVGQNSTKPSVATAKWDTNGTGMSGGTDTGIDLIFGTTPQTYDDPIIIPPGMSVGIDAYLLAAIAASVSLDLRFLEF